MILRTPTIFQAVQAMKESEMNRVEPAWQHAKAGYEYTHFLMNLEDYPEDCSFPTNTRKNPVELDEKLLLKKKQVLLPFSKHDGALQDPGNADARIQAARNDTRPISGRQV